MKLTEKQRLFAEYYLETANAEDSAKRAGYKSPRGNAHKLLQNTAIRSYIDERVAQKDEAQIAKQDEVLSYLTAVMRGEHKEEVLRGVGEGEQTISDMDVGAAQRIRAAELLGKRYGIWTEKQEIDVKGAVVFQDDIGAAEDGD